MKARRILTLDLASRIGYAFGATGQKPAFGAHQLPTKNGDDLGAYLTAFDTFLFALPIEEWTDDGAAVVFECSVLPPKTSYRTLRKLYALPALLEFRWATVGGDPACLREVYASQVKKYWTGKGNAKKPDMIAAAVERGYDIGPAQDDEADAIAMWHFAAACLNSEGVEYST